MRTSPTGTKHLIPRRAKPLPTPITCTTPGKKLVAVSSTTLEQSLQVGHARHGRNSLWLLPGWGPVGKRLQDVEEVVRKRWLPGLLQRLRVLHRPCWDGGNEKVLPQLLVRRVLVHRKLWGGKALLRLLDAVAAAPAGPRPRRAGRLRSTAGQSCSAIPIPARRRCTHVHKSSKKVPLPGPTACEAAGEETRAKYPHVKMARHSSASIVGCDRSRP